MEAPITVQRVEKFTVVELRTPTLMDPDVIDQIGQSLNRLVDEEDRRLIVIDFEQVQYLSSQAIGIIINLHKRVSALPHGTLVLCGVGEKLMQLMKITRLDKVLTIRPTQHEAVKVMPK